MISFLRSKLWASNLLALIFSLIVTVLVILAVQRDLKLERGRQEAESFSHLKSLLKERLNSFTYGLQGMGGVVVTQQFHPSFSQVRTYAEFRNFFSNMPGALGYGFIRVIDPSSRDEYIQTKRKENPQFNIRVINPHKGKLYIIEFIEPIEKNLLARGLDIASEATRLRAANRAIDTGEPSLTGRIDLVQAEHNQTGFLYLYPIFRGNFPRTKEERRKNIVGFSYSPILLSTLYEFLEKNNTKFDLAMRDITDAKNGQVLFEFKNSSSLATLSETISIGGRLWRLEAAPFRTSSNTFLFIVISIAFGGFFYVISFYVITSFVKSSDLSEQLDTVESWRRSVLDHTELSMIATDLNGIITVFNRGAETMLGYQSDEVIGIRTPEFIHVKDEVLIRHEALEKELNLNLTPGFDTFVARARLTGETDSQNWTYVRKDGSTFPVNLSVSCIRNGEGVITGYLGVAEDLTRKKELETLVEQQRSAMMVSAKFSALGELAGNVAHEINNPLAIIAGKVKVLELMASEDENLKYIIEDLKSIEATVFRASQIVKGLKKFARDGSRDPMVPVKVSQLISDVFDLCSERLRIYGVSFEKIGHDDGIILCRPVEISQILMNLITNAFDAVKSEPIREIKVVIENWESSCVIRIIDSGPPIQPDVVKKMFEPFFTTKDVNSGTGLGLSISKGIAEAHGGKLTYETDGIFTSFVLQLPSVVT